MSTRDDDPGCKNSIDQLGTNAAHDDGLCNYSPVDPNRKANNYPPGHWDIKDKSNGARQSLEQEAAALIPAEKQPDAEDEHAALNGLGSGHPAGEGRAWEQFTLEGDLPASARFAMREWMSVGSALDFGAPSAQPSDHSHSASELPDVSAGRLGTTQGRCG